ncbi:MAG: MoxR family ATPase, partial [Thermoleophilia bacterium]
MNPIGQIQRDHGIVGRGDELAMALAVLGAGRHLLLEGPVGVGKTTVALAVCVHLGRSVVRVDGDDRYSESKLTGWFDPPLVLARGYSEDTFFAGPLVQAMRQGSVLFVNELNRMPEAVQNVLLPALDEGLLIVPRIGDVRAAQGFQVVATQNPVEYIATGHLSEALRDRFEHVGLDYQSAGEEAEIVRRETACDDQTLIDQAVAIARATRSDPRFRKGASVRAAIAM